VRGVRQVTNHTAAGFIPQSPQPNQRPHRRGVIHRALDAPPQATNASCAPLAGAPGVSPGLRYPGAPGVSPGFRYSRAPGVSPGFRYSRAPGVSPGLKQRGRLRPSSLYPGVSLVLSRPSSSPRPSHGSVSAGSRRRCTKPRQPRQPRPRQTKSELHLALTTPKKFISYLIVGKPAPALNPYGPSLRISADQRQN